MAHVLSPEGVPVSAMTNSEPNNRIDELNRKNAEILKNLEPDESDELGDAIMADVGKVSGNDIVSLLSKMAVCPVCCQYYAGNVFQCKNGHNICLDCLDQCTRQRTPCPQCRQPFGVEKIRNTSFESVLGGLDIKVPCKYKAMGCNELVNYSKVHDHWRKCQFRPANCFFHGCTFTSKDNAAYFQHLCSTHETIPGDLPDSEYFPLDVQNMCAQMNAMRSRHHTASITYAHKFYDDYLIVHILYANRGDYYVSIYSMNNKYYTANVTFQVSRIAFTSTTEIMVVPINKLEKLYTKMSDNAQNFYTYYNEKGYLWHTAILSQIYINQLANYPNVPINFTLMMPTARQMEEFTKIDESPNFKLMDNPVEDSLPPEIAEAILSGDGSYGVNEAEYFGQQNSNPYGAHNFQLQDETEQQLSESEEDES